MALPYADGTFTTWQIDGAVSLEYPMVEDTSHVIVRQDYVGLIANYAAPNVSGAVHSTYNTAYCVGDTAITPLGGGLGRVTRTWASVPATTNTPIAVGYTFPGFYSSFVERVPLRAVVFGRVQSDYYFTTTPTSSITIVDRQKYVSNTSAYSEVDYLNDGGAGLYPTTPTLANYKSWANSNTEVVASESTIDRYLGFIWRRDTVYVKAQ